MLGCLHALSLSIHHLTLKSKNYAHLRGEEKEGRVVKCSEITWLLNSRKLMFDKVGSQLLYLPCYLGDWSFPNFSDL